MHKDAMRSCFLAGVLLIPRLRGPCPRPQLFRRLKLRKLLPRATLQVVLCAVASKRADGLLADSGSIPYRATTTTTATNPARQTHALASLSVPCVPLAWLILSHGPAKREQRTTLVL